MDEAPVVAPVRQQVHASDRLAVRTSSFERLTGRASTRQGHDQVQPGAAGAGPRELSPDALPLDEAADRGPAHAEDSVDAGIEDQQAVRAPIPRPQLASILVVPEVPQNVASVSDPQASVVGPDAGFGTFPSSNLDEVTKAVLAEREPIQSSLPLQAGRTAVLAVPEVDSGP